MLKVSFKRREMFDLNDYNRYSDDEIVILYSGTISVLSVLSLKRVPGERIKETMWKISDKAVRWNRRRFGVKSQAG